ncbi:unnamed protein product [Gadus morhua 'NCC']
MNPFRRQMSGMMEPVYLIVPPPCTPVPVLKSFFHFPARSSWPSQESAGKREKPIGWLEGEKAEGGGVGEWGSEEAPVEPVYLCYVSAAAVVDACTSVSNMVAGRGRPATPNRRRMADILEGLLVTVLQYTKTNKQEAQLAHDCRHTHSVLL